MQLDCAGTIVSQPGPEDIASAFPQTPPPAGWTLSLTDDSGSSLIAIHVAHGEYMLRLTENGSTLKARDQLKEKSVERLFGQFLRGDQGWRRHVKWQGAPDQASASDQSQASSPYSNLNSGMSAAGPGRFVQVGLGGAAVLLIGLPFFWEYTPFAKLSIRDLPMPAVVDSLAARIILLGAIGFAAVFVIAGIAKWREMRGARGWKTAPGEITRSQTVFKSVQRMPGEMPVNRKVLDIGYSYKVGNSSYNGSRISFADIIGEEENDAYLARYQPGTAVTIHYDSTSPSNAVLEYGTPPDVARGCFYIIAFGIAATLVLMLAVTHGAEGVRTVLPNSIPAALAITLIAGLAFTAFLVSHVRSVARSLSWVPVTATILRTEIVEFTASHRRRSGTFSSGVERRKAWKPVVEYSYSALGKQHISRSIWHAAENAGSEAYARSVIDRYKPGTFHQARYNPAAPQQAWLERGGMAGPVVLFIAAALCLLAAYWFSGLNADWAFWVNA